MQPTLSLCMITKNEEEFLEKCLDSVKDIVDEIIIVDTGSTDKTIEIAKRFNAKIVQSEWNNDFSKARNESIKHATKDWILFLDADETISKNDLVKIKELLKDKEVMGYSFVQRSYTNDSSSPKWESGEGDTYEESKQYSGWIYSGIIRIFQNHKGISFEFPVHETVKESIKRLNGKIKNTLIPIHHYGKVRSDDFVDEKSRLYLKLGKKKIEEAPTAKSYYELGVQHQVLKEYDQAIENFKKGLEVDSGYIGCYVNLGSVYCILKRFDDAVDILLKGLLKDKNQPDLHNNLGLAYEAKNKEDKAIEEYKLSVQLNPNHVEAYSNLARLFFKRGMSNEVCDIYKKIIIINPKNLYAYNNLAGILLQLNNSEEAIKVLAKATQMFPENADLLANLGVIYAQKKEFRKALELCEKALKLNPKNKEVLLKNIEMLKKDMEKG